MATTAIDLWNQIGWAGIDPTAQRLLLAHRVNRGESLKQFCARVGARYRTVARLANTEGFEELQSLLLTLEDLERENRHLRSQLAAARNAVGGGDPGR